MTQEICIVPDCNKPVEKFQGRHICAMHRSRLGRYKSYEIPEKTFPEGIVKICKVHGNLTESQVMKRIKGKDWLSCVQCIKGCSERFYKKVGAAYGNNRKKDHYISHSDGLKLSKIEYNRMLEEQNNACAICKQSEQAIGNKKTGKTRRLAIDHCHETKTIRGLLCLSCNSNLERSVKFRNTSAARDYLEKYKT